MQSINILSGDKDGRSFCHSLIIDNLIDHVRIKYIPVKIWSSFVMFMMTVGIIVLAFGSYDSFMNEDSGYGKFIVIFTSVFGLLVMSLIIRLAYKFFRQSDVIIFNLQERNFTYRVARCINKETSIGSRGHRSYYAVFDCGEYQERVSVHVYEYDNMTVGHYYNIFYIPISKKRNSIVKFTTADSVMNNTEGEVDFYE